MPKCVIDGREIDVPAGTTVIQAGLMAGIEIPHFCWHPDLPVDGNCRMCLVEIEKMPKLQIACNTVVSDGMVVRTTSEKAVQAHRTTLEFLLVNHPIDCPVCDQAGECYLQEYYMDYDRQRSRVPLPAKVRKQKAKPIGPLVILDQERCVLCSRCVRFLDEVTHTNELAFYQRGDHVDLDLAPGRTLDNPYSGNVVDICPVGALTNRDFRFRARVWYLERTESVCGACANGCNIEIYHREGTIFRFQPRENDAVNQYWMCDAGRMSYRDLQGEVRLTQPLVRGAEEFAPATWESALGAVAARLREGGAGIVVSAHAPNEEVYLLRHIGAAVNARVAGISWSPPGAFHDDFLVKADKNPNTQGLRLQGLAPDGGVDELLAAADLRTLVLHRADLATWRGAGAALERVPYLVVLDTDLRETAEYANVVLPIGTYAESDGTFTNHAGRVQRFRPAVKPPGGARPGWEALGALLVALGVETRFGSAEAVFAALAAECPPFSGLSYHTLGTLGQPAAG